MLWLRDADGHARSAPRGWSGGAVRTALLGSRTAAAWLDSIGELLRQSSLGELIQRVCRRGPARSSLGRFLPAFFVLDDILCRPVECPKFAERNGFRIPLGEVLAATLANSAPPSSSEVLPNSGWGSFPGAN